MNNGTDKVTHNEENTIQYTNSQEDTRKMKIKKGRMKVVTNISGKIPNN